MGGERGREVEFVSFSGVYLPETGDWIRLCGCRSMETPVWKSGEGSMKRK